MLCWNSWVFDRTMFGLTPGNAETKTEYGTTAKLHLIFCATRDDPDFSLVNWFISKKHNIRIYSFHILMKQTRVNPIKIVDGIGNSLHRKTRGADKTGFLISRPFFPGISPSISVSPPEPRPSRSKDPICKKYTPIRRDTFKHCAANQYQFILGQTSKPTEYKTLISPFWPSVLLASGAHRIKH